MRIVCLCNNRLGWQVLQWLREQGQEIVALVIHSGKSGKYQNEIRSVVRDTACLVLEAEQIAQPEGLDQIRSCSAELAVSVLFRNLLRTPFLSLFPQGCINLHPGFLPYNRGVYPNVWSIVDKTPAGVTLHYLDEGLDTGDIIAQQQIVIEPTDTGGSLYSKLEHAGLALFQHTWPLIEAGQAPRMRQDLSQGTCHRLRDVDAIDEIDPGQMYRGEDLINLIRARTFPPYQGAYFRYKGRKIYLRLELSEE